MFYLSYNNIYIIPVCHYRMEFAFEVRQTILKIEPDAVAVEFPSTLEKYIKEAVNRFPFLSVIFYSTRDGDYVYFPMEPTDPMAEAARTGKEIGASVYCVDLDLDKYPLIYDPMPDSYALQIIGLENYYKCYKRFGKKFHLPEDEKREQYMAYKLRKLSYKHNKVVFVVGMAHAENVLRHVKRKSPQPIGKVKREDIEIFNLSLDSIREVTSEAPFIIALYETARGGGEVPKPSLSKSNVVSLVERQRQKRAYSNVANNSQKVKPLVEDSDFQKLAKRIFKHLMSIEEPFQKKKLSVEEEEKLFKMWLLNSAPKDGFTKVHKFKTCEDRREDLLKFYKSLSHLPIDRQKALMELVKRAATHYRENVHEEILPWQLKIFSRFSRNYAYVSGMLIPDVYQMVISARGCADDNFAYEVWDILTYYPWIDTSSKYTTVNIKADEVWLYGRKITLRRKYPYFRRRLMNVVKKRHRESYPGEWSEKFKKGWICSYPPEDITIENYGTYLKKKGMNILAEEHTYIYPFTTSLLDGIDIRETMRHWHEKKIYVLEKAKISGGVGSVVVIFDEDLENTKFPWKLTWLGEHHQESDMAFYSTHPANKIVGPGIARCTYGGFMMTYPPGRLFDVWADPFYFTARSKSEVLLMAAVEYSLEKNVVYVAKSPPPSRVQSFANHLGKKIIYIPIGNLSPITLKKIRTFHILADSSIRKIAKNYIW